MYTASEQNRITFNIVNHTCRYKVRKYSEAEESSIIVHNY